MTGPEHQSVPQQEIELSAAGDERRAHASGVDTLRHYAHTSYRRRRQNGGQLLVKISPAAMRRLRIEADQCGGRPEILASQLLDRKLTQQAGMVDRNAGTAERTTVELTRGESPRAAQSFLFVTKRHHRLAAVLDWVQAQGAFSMVVSGIDEALDHIHTDRWTCAIFEIDSLGELKDIVGTIVELRDQRPNLPVILVTRHVQRDDFDHLRLPLCDVTLRFPVDTANFSFAVDEAIVNNRVWIARRRIRHMSSVNDI